MLVKKFTLTIDLENAAFDDYPDELELKIRSVAGYVKQGRISGRVVDTNGNVCGRFDIKDDQEPILHPSRIEQSLIDFMLQNPPESSKSDGR